MEQRNYIVFIALMFAIFGLFWYVLPHFFPRYFAGPSEYTQTNTSTSGILNSFAIGTMIKRKIVKSKASSIQPNQAAT